MHGHKKQECYSKKKFALLWAPCGELPIFPTEGRGMFIFYRDRNKGLSNAFLVCTVSFTANFFLVCTCNKNRLHSCFWQASMSSEKVCSWCLNKCRLRKIGHIKPQQRFIKDSYWAVMLAGWLTGRKGDGLSLAEGIIEKVYLIYSSR